MRRLTEYVGKYPHGRPGKTYAEAIESTDVCRGEFEATACVERLAAYEDTGLEPDEIPHWHDGPLPICGPNEMPWFVIEAPSWIGGLPDYGVVRWMGRHWSDKRAYRAEKWMKLALPQPPKEEK